jgi:hypothetical protein
MRKIKKEIIVTISWDDGQKLSSSQLRVMGMLTKQDLPMLQERLVFKRIFG